MYTFTVLETNETYTFDTEGFAIAFRSLADRMGFSYVEEHDEDR